MPIVTGLFGSGVLICSKSKQFRFKQLAMNWGGVHPQKNNIDTRNDGLQKVTPFKHGHLWSLR